MLISSATTKPLFQQSIIHCSALRAQTTDNLSRFQIIPSRPNQLRTLKINPTTMRPYSNHHIKINVGSLLKNHLIQSSKLSSYPKLCQQFTFYMHSTQATSNCHHQVFKVGTSRTKLYTPCPVAITYSGSDSGKISILATPTDRPNRINLASQITSSHRPRRR